LIPALTNLARIPLIDAEGLRMPEILELTGIHTAAQLFAARPQGGIKFLFLEAML
jgi:hypothetical protein